MGIRQSIYDKSAKISVLAKYQDAKSSAGKSGAHQNYAGYVVKHIIQQLFSSQEHWEAKEKFGYFQIFLNMLSDYL